MVSRPPGRSSRDAKDFRDDGHHAREPRLPLRAVKAGAANYVLKDASGEGLLSAVRRPLRGEWPLNQELAMRLLVRLARRW